MIIVKISYNYIWKHLLSWVWHLTASNDEAQVFEFGKFELPIY